MVASVSAANSSVRAARSRLATMSVSEPSEKCFAMAWRQASSVLRRAALKNSRSSPPDRRFRRSLRQLPADTRPPPYAWRGPTTARRHSRSGCRSGRDTCRSSSRDRAASSCRRHREKADADLRHGEDRILGHHAVRAVDGDADAAAHADAVDQRDVGLFEALDLGVEAVLVGEELGRRLAVLPAS